MTNKTFKDVPVMPFERHWMCSVCDTELVFVRETETGYLHECSGCYPGRQEAKEKYPGIIHKQVEP